MLQWTIVFFVGFIAVHFFKMVRLYLVLMEHRIPFWRFVLLYFRTTLVNLIVPFKLGELYRVEEIARETRVWQVGLLSVLVDRYFDTVALFLILLPFDLLFRGQLSLITLLLLFIIAFVALVYCAIPVSYAYLNRYLIMRRASGRTMAALRGLDVVKSWFDFTKNLITGRSVLIILFSFLGWACETVTLKALAMSRGLPFGFGDFGAYIEAIFATGSSELLQIYTAIGAAALLALTIAGYAVKWIGSSRKGSV
jgi:hypothetical protein